MFFLCSYNWKIFDSMNSAACCVFCQEPLGGRKTSEHILLNALGGKVTTEKLSCATCNNQFGNTIDRELAEQFTAVRNLFEMISGDGRDAPSLRKVQAGSRTVNLLGNGKITLAEKPFIVEKAADGAFRVEINVQSMDEVEHIIPHIVARTGILEERLREQLANAPFTETQMRPGAINLQFSFGGEEVMRAVAKACLLLWGRKFGNNEIQRTEYDDVRRFIKSGDTDFMRERTFLDSRPLALADKIESKYGPLFNMIYVSSDILGRVIGHFTICNLIGFQIILVEIGAIPSETARLANNPLDPKTWSDKAVDVPEISFAWLDQRRNEIDEYQLRFTRMMEAYQTVMGRRAHLRIIDQVLAKYGFATDDAIPSNLIDPIAHEIGTRIAFSAMGIPLTMPVPPDQVADSLKRVPKE